MAIKPLAQAVCASGTQTACASPELT